MRGNQPVKTPRLSWAQVCARRLERHALFAPLEAARPADIAGALCGVHAQVFSAAEWSVGLRISGVTRADIQNALWVDHSLIKAFGPRGTVHLLAAEDLPVWTGALSAIPQSPGRFPQNVRMTPDQTEVVTAAISAALRDAELTLDELHEAVVSACGSWAGDLVMPAFNGMWPRWRQVMSTIGTWGVLCFGPNRGRNITYTDPRRWLPGFEPAARPAALVGAVKRYLAAYGPATPAQFARWLGAPTRWASDLFDSLSAELEQVELDGEPAWVAAGDTAAPGASPPTVRLLPYFDAYVVGSHPREKVYPGRAAERALTPTGQAGNYPVLLVDGIAAGVWHLRRSGRRLAITVEPFEPLTTAQRRALDEQVGRIGDFLDGRPELTIGPVSVGGHA